MEFIKKAGKVVEENQGLIIKVGIGLLAAFGVVKGYQALGRVMAEEDAEYEVVSDEIVTETNELPE